MGRKKESKRGKNNFTFSRATGVRLLNKLQESGLAEQTLEVYLFYPPGLMEGEEEMKRETKITEA